MNMAMVLWLGGVGFWWLACAYTWAMKREDRPGWADGALVLGLFAVWPLSFPLTVCALAVMFVRNMKKDRP